jgi:hypothetical protein
MYESAAAAHLGGTSRTNQQQQLIANIFNGFLNKKNYLFLVVGYDLEGRTCLMHTIKPLLLIIIKNMHHSEQTSNWRKMSVHRGRKEAWLHTTHFLMVGEENIQ